MNCVPYQGIPTPGEDLSSEPVLVSHSGGEDESIALLLSEIGDHPTCEHNRFVTEADQGQDMNEAPDQPGDKAGEIHIAEVSNGPPFAYRRH